MKNSNFKTLSRRGFLGAAGSVAATAALNVSVQSTCAKSGLGAGGISPAMFGHRFAPAESFTHTLERPFRDSLCLNGKWQFQPVLVPPSFKPEEGVAPALPPAEMNCWDPVPLQVPSPWNVNSFADHHGEGGDFRCFPSYPKHWEAVQMGWLRKKVWIPAEWQGRCIQIHFLAVAGDALILCNGQEVGRHFDIFLPFSVNVSHAVRFGEENEILVGVRKASLFDKPGPYGRRNYQGGSFWGQHIAGIWQDVHLVVLPEIHVSDVFIQPDVAGDQLRVQVTVANSTANEVEVKVKGSAYAWIPPDRSRPIRAAEPSEEYSSKESLNLPSVVARIQAGSTAVVELHQKVGTALNLWAPEHPSLHGLNAKIESGGSTCDSKLTRFGWRQISFAGSQVLLNSAPLILKGDSWHFMGTPQMTRRYAWAWYSAVRQAGMNAVRLHAQPYPQFYLDVADELGILVLDESGVWASDGGPKLDDPAFWADTLIHIEGLIKRDRNHPSVFGWSVCNEVWPIIRFIFRDPPGMMQVAAKHYALWAETCRRLDPTRPWISADGDEDGEGHLPVFMVHYGGISDMERAKASGKPWGVGETGNAYYGSPRQVSEANGDRAYESCLGRMEGVAISSYQNLREERAQGAVYRSVFNLVWYGLRPLPLGLRDTRQAPTLEDGVRLAPQMEASEGMQPERLGAYCTTLNPGYDSALPLFQTWPLFDAIRDANAEPPIDGTWSRKPVSRTEISMPNPVRAERVTVLGGDGSRLADALRDLGASPEEGKESNVPQVLFVDGEVPPAGDARRRIEVTLRARGTVFVWGADPDSLLKLNALLPKAVVLSRRSVSSLLPSSKSQRVYGLLPGNLYFCEQDPATIVHVCLDGPFVHGASVLLRACDTDWLRWNGQPEYAKTAMVYRSELEKKPSGIVMVERKVGNGSILLATLPRVPQSLAVEATLRQLLTNLGIPLKASANANRPFLRNGTLVRALACGYVDNAVAAERFLTAEPSAHTGIEFAGRRWKSIQSQFGRFDLAALDLPGPKDPATVFLSFWLYSPRDLSNLLLEPNLPHVGLVISGSGEISVRLNGSEVPQNLNNSGHRQIEGLALRAGWNQFLMRSRHSESSWELSARLVASQPEFLKQLDSALERIDTVATVSQ